MEKRKYLVAGNWKCNGSIRFVREMTNDFLNKLVFDQSKTEVIVAPMIIHIPSLKAMLYQHL